MPLVFLVFLSQLVDGLTFAFAFGRGQELNPFMNEMGNNYGLFGVLLTKFSIAAVLFVACIPVKTRRKLLLSLTTVGVIGACTNLLGII